MQELLLSTVWPSLALLWPTLPLGAAQLVLPEDLERLLPWMWVQELLPAPLSPEAWPPEWGLLQPWRGPWRWALLLVLASATVSAQVWPAPANLLLQHWAARLQLLPWERPLPAVAVPQRQQQAAQLPLPPAAQLSAPRPAPVQPPRPPHCRRLRSAVFPAPQAGRRRRPCRARQSPGMPAAQR